MNASQGLAAFTAALVHPEVAGSAPGRTRHQIFILRTLALAFSTLAIAPFFLAFCGAPTPAQALIFSLGVAPLCAVMLVLRTGRLAAGHFICACCLTGIGSVAAISGEAGLGCALAWLIVAQIESLLGLEPRFAVLTAALSVAAFGGLSVAALAGQLPVAARPGDIAIGLALAYAIVNVFCALALHKAVNKGGDAQTNRAQISRAQVIAELVGDLVVSHDTEGSVDFVGRACERLLNIPEAELVGRGLFEHVHVADRPLFLKTIADAAHCGGLVTATVRLRGRAPEPRRDGEFNTTFLWVEMRARSLGQPNGGVLSLLRDVTEDRRNALDLQSAREAAAAASQSKDHFLANMSHELRTPLNAIIGFSEMLANSELRPKDLAKQGEYARIIHQSGQHLLAVVNSILDMAKIQSGTFSINPEPFLVAPLIDSCCEIVTLKALQDGIEIVRADRNSADALVGDRRACKQILINLLSNAVKFTPANGRVTVATRPEGTALLISVADTGIGIGAEDLLRLGDPFFQAKSALDRPYEGTGLGLSVVRGLVGLHGGSIAIESEPGCGTRVTVRLPLDCRFVTPQDGAAAIETIPRRRASDVTPDRFASQSFDTKVKKIA